MLARGVHASDALIRECIDAVGITNLFIEQKSWTHVKGTLTRYGDYHALYPCQNLETAVGRFRSGHAHASSKSLNDNDSNAKGGANLFLSRHDVSKLTTISWIFDLS